MKTMIRVILVMSIVWLGIFACTKHTEVNEKEAQDLKASQGTPWIQASSNETQFMDVSPTQVTLNQLDGAAKVDLNGGEITLKLGGTYFIVAAPQVGRIGTNLSGVVSFKCWLRVNGIDATNSNVLLNLKPWTKDVIISQGAMTLEAGDVITVMTSCSVMDKGVAIEAIQPSGEPLVPSIIFTMYKIN